MTDVRNVVLVHGGFVDGSGWQGVYDLLTADGFNVSVVQNQTLSLESDVETTHNVLDQQDGPAILVGHSYGGVVITEAGRHERVAGLVYIAAFAPDAGESVNTLIADPPPGAPVPPILPPQDGFLFLDREKFAESFAADLPAELAAFMADSQVPWGVEALNGAVSEPAWRSKPSWYLVATDDRMIPPPAQRAMSERAGSTVVEAPGSHSIYVSQPDAWRDADRAGRPGGARRDARRQSDDERSNINRHGAAGGSRPASSPSLSRSRRSRAARSSSHASPRKRRRAKPTIVLVHGGWADSSGWNSEVTRLAAARLSGHRAGEPAARPRVRRRVRPQRPADDRRPDRARRPLLRRRRDHATPPSAFRT